jgi:hypothetical protein
VECAVIPTKGPTVLAPSVTIEEVIVVDGKIRDRSTAETRDQIEWRGKIIPIFSLENANTIGQKSEKKRIVAILRQGHGEGFTYVGIVAVQIPQMVQAQSHNLKEDVKPPALYPYALSYARLDETPVIILDLDYLLRLCPS